MSVQKRIHTFKLAQVMMFWLITVVTSEQKPDIGKILILETMAKASIKFMKEISVTMMETRTASRFPVVVDSKWRP